MDEKLMLDPEKAGSLQIKLLVDILVNVLSTKHLLFCGVMEKFIWHNNYS
jgi:hypothetical protein